MGEASLQLRSVSIIGGGAWGTALAQTLAHNGTAVTLWAREPEIVDDINARHVNRVFLPGVDLNHSIHATGDLASVATADAILAVAPAQHLRGVMAKLARHLPAAVPVVICSKGIEQDTGKFMGDVLGDLSSRRGKIGGMTQRGEAQVIVATVPLGEMFGYSTKLRSMSQGRAVYSMEFAHYEEVPKSKAEEIVAKVNK